MSTGYLPQNTKNRFSISRIKLSGEKGQVEWVMGLYSILFMAVMMCFGLQIEAYRQTSLYMEDALAASNLASALMDVEEYGISGKIVLNNPAEHFEIYKNALKNNLSLDDEWKCVNTGLISGEVVVEQYIIYNVDGDKVDVVKIDSMGNETYENVSLDNAFAPNGVKIESTGVYSEISFMVEGFLGVSVNAMKGKLIDVAKN
jgi:hypothetical protein